MNKATGFAMAPTGKLRAILVAGLMSAVLAACGGGAQTVDNPLPNVTGPTTVIYNGTAPPRDSDVQAFLNNFWTPMQNTATCGNCHNETTMQTPMFAQFGNINDAYDEALLAADLGVPSNSLLVSKVRGTGGANGHNCWLGDANACGDIMTTWIEGWAGATAGGGGRQIVLTPPPPVEPGDSKSYSNATAENFRDIVYTPYLERYCSGCHNSASALSQQPYFAESGDPLTSYLSAYEAAKPRMDLDDPANSQFVMRLAEGHNLVDWPNITAAQASEEMRVAIAAFAATVPTIPLDPLLVNSKAVTLTQGTVASGGNRYENDQIALWEFKKPAGGEPVAYDTSGVVPSLNLNLTGEFEWFGGWGVTFRAGDPLLGQSDGRGQGSTTDSQKLYDEIRQTGEYSIEAWVVPANVTQEMARIVTYSGGETARNFTLQQTLYNYDFQHRNQTTGANGDQPTLSTPDAAEVLQATLQHVVATFSATEGRNIYVNGMLVAGPDPAPPGTMTDWDDTFAFVLGNEAGGNGRWQGTIRLAAIHKFALTPAQIQQNFDVGVGEKFFLLFSIGEVFDSVNPAPWYILFEVAQYDSYSYLFTKPHFITLDGSVPSADIPIQGMRIGINGGEVDKSQSYGNLDDVLSSNPAMYGDLGQPLSRLGAVIPLEKGPEDDEFFLTFDLLGVETYVRTDDPPLVITEVDLPPADRFGVRTFDEINATFAAVTGVDPEENNVDMTFQNLRQSLPAIEDPKSFLSSHQVAIAQLAFEYCNALMEDRGTISTSVMFPAFNFNAQPATAYANRDALLTPLIDRLMGVAVLSQPDFTVVRNELGVALAGPNPLTDRPANLIDRMLAPNPDPQEPQADTRGIAKGACGAVLGSAIALVQ